MEYIAGFISGFILAHIISYMIYKNNLDELLLDFEYKLKQITEVNRK